MRTIVVLILMLWCGSAWAEDCKWVGRAYGSDYGYQQCRIANALEKIAEAIKEKKA